MTQQYVQECLLDQIWYQADAMIGSQVCDTLNELALARFKLLSDEAAVLSVRDSMTRDIESQIKISMRI